jgi:O-antigen ligase
VQFSVAAVLAVTPLLILPGYFFYYDVTPKIALVLIAAAVMLPFFLEDRMPQRLWKHPLGRALCVLTLAQSASLLLSTVLSTHPALSWNGGNWRRLGFVSQFAVLAFGLVVAATQRGTSLHILLRAISAAGLGASIYGILQYFGVDPLLSPANYRVGEGATAIVRPPSTLGHADYFGAYLLYVVFFGAALLAMETNRRWKALGSAAAMAGSAAVVLSGTRGALAGLAAGAVLLGIWNRQRVSMRHAAIGAGFCAASLVFLLSPRGTQLRARLMWAREDLKGGARLWLWRDSLRMAANRPLIGYGPDTFGIEFPQYQSVELSRAYPDFYHESPHDILLDALVSQGIPGLVVLGGFIGLGWMAPRKQPGAPYLLAALAAGLVSGTFVCFTLTGYLYFYATIALLVGPVHERETQRSPVLARIAAAPVIALFLSFAFQVTLSDMFLARAKRALDTGLIADALTAYAQSLRWHTAGSSDDLYFSRALAAESRRASPQAFAIAKRAVETSEERQNAWYSLAGFYSTRNDLAGVETCLHRSVEAAPSWFKPHWALAQVLELSGRHTEALAEAARAADLDGAKDAEIAKFLQTLHHSAGVPGPK